MLKKNRLKFGLCGLLEGFRVCAIPEVSTREICGDMAQSGPMLLIIRNKDIILGVPGARQEGSNPLAAMEKRLYLLRRSWIP